MDTCRVTELLLPGGDEDDIEIFLWGLLWLSRFPPVAVFLVLLFLTVALAMLLLELLEGPPDRLLLGEDTGVALITSDDCAGESELFWCTDNDDLFGILPGMTTDICDGTLEGPDWRFDFSRDETVVAEALQGDEF